MISLWWAMLMTVVWLHQGCQGQQYDACNLPPYCAPNATLPVPGNCTAYRECVGWGDWAVYQCTDNQVYDKASSQCADSGECEEQCDGPPLPPPPVRGEATRCPESTLPCVEGEKHPDSTYCDAYQECVLDGIVWLSRLCPYDKFFDRQQQECVDPDTVDCTSRCAISDTTTERSTRRPRGTTFPPVGHAARIGGNMASSVLGIICLLLIGW